MIAHINDREIVKTKSTGCCLHVIYIDELAIFLLTIHAIQLAFSSEKRRNWSSFFNYYVTNFSYNQYFAPKNDT